MNFNDIQKLFQVGFVKDFFDKKNLNHIFTGCPKSALSGCILNFWIKNLEGIRNQMLRKVKKFLVVVV